MSAAGAELALGQGQHQPGARQVDSLTRPHGPPFPQTRRANPGVALRRLARAQRGVDEVQFEEVCRAHPEAADAPRELHPSYAEFEDLERRFGLVGSPSEPLASMYCSKAYPHVELEREDEGDSTSKLLGRLSDRAPNLRRIGSGS